MKKNLTAVVAVVLALASLAAAAYVYIDASRTLEDYDAQLAELEEQNEALRRQMEALSLPTEEVSVPVDMEAWDLTAEAWTDGAGADITLTVVPTVYQADLEVRLQVSLNGELAADLPCTWDGGAYTAAVSLPGANGYSYLLSLGNTYFDLNEAALVNLADSLSAYCNLIIDSWELADQTLVLTGYPQVQLPEILPGGVDLACQAAALVLLQNGAEISRTAVELQPGETQGSYEMAGEIPAIALPDLSAGDVLEVKLEVTLNDGRLLTAWGGSWLCTDDGLEMAAG